MTESVGHRGVVDGPDQAAAAALFDLCSNLLAVIDFSARIVIANPAWEHVLGYPMDTVVGRPVIEFVHPDDVQTTLDDAAERFGNAEQEPYQNRFVAADGSVRRMSWTVRTDFALRRVYAVGRDITDRAVIEAALHLAEDESHLLGERLESTLASIADGFLALDRNGVCTYANDGALALLDIARADLVGRRMWDAYPSSPGADYRREWDLALDTQTARVLKHRSKRTGRWLEVSLYPWPDGLSAHFRDVTAREEAAVMRDDYERQLQAQALLLHTAHDAMVACDLNGVVTYWNPGAERMYGWSSAEAVGRPLTALIRREEQDLDSEVVSQMRQSGGWSGRLWHSHRDGRRIAVEVSTSLVRDADGGITAAFAVMTDVSARVELEDRLNDALDVGGMAAWEYDIRTDRVWRQRQFDRLFGYLVDDDDDDGPHRSADDETDTWTRARFLAHVLPEDLDVVLSGERGALPSGRFRNEFRVRWPDGSIHWLAARGGLLLDDRGQAERARGTLLDITDRKRLEDERMVLEQQLGQARKMEAVGRLAGGVAHDFNNLLTVINGYTELAIHRTHDTILRDQLGSVALAGARAADLTQQLLALSRRQQVSLRPIDLNAVVADAQRLLTRLIGGDIEVLTGLSAEIGPVLGDEGQLSQVLLNLAVNARDAMPSGGTLTIETARVTETAGSDPGGTGFVRLSVSDTGRGMDADTLARVFEPFFTTKPTGQGTGLGLSTVYGVVEQSGGRIDVRSRPGEGTVFDVYLPSAGAPADDDGAAEVVRTADRSAHVLLVEDDPAVRSLVADMLQMLGYRATVVDGPVAALATVLDDVDIVLTDVLMPAMNGRELASRLRERPRGDGYGELQIIYMSGFASTVISEQFPLEERQGFLQKPFGMADLRDRLQAAAGHARG